MKFVNLSFLLWWCQIVLGVKLSSLHGRCQIVLFCMVVSNCPGCQIVLLAWLVSNCPITEKLACKVRCCRFSQNSCSFFGLEYKSWQFVSNSQVKHPPSRFVAQNVSICAFSWVKLKIIGNLVCVKHLTNFTSASTYSSTFDKQWVSQWLTCVYYEWTMVR